MSVSILTLKNLDFQYVECQSGAKSCVKGNRMHPIYFLYSHYSTSACSNLDCLSFSDYLFKLLLIGDSGVGKSCLLLRFAVSCLASPSETSFRHCSRAKLWPSFYSLLHRTTPTQRATSARSESTSRSAPSNWTARPSNCRLWAQACVYTWCIMCLHCHLLTVFPCCLGLCLPVGHCRSREVPYHHVKLLPRSPRHHRGVRCDRSGGSHTDLFISIWL